MEKTPNVRKVPMPYGCQSFEIRATDCEKDVAEKPIVPIKAAVSKKRKAAKGSRKAAAIPKSFVPRMTWSSTTVVVALNTNTSPTMYDLLEGDYQSTTIARHFLPWYTEAKGTKS